jgi:hypothetical protein
MNAIIRWLLKGMAVSVLCLAQQRPALSEDASEKGRRDARAHSLFL